MSDARPVTRSRARRVTGVLAAVSSMAMVALVPVALPAALRAGAAPAPPPAPTLGPLPPNCTPQTTGPCTVESRAGTLSVSPHIVHPGGHFTVVFSPVPGYHDLWGIEGVNFPGTPDAGCKSQVRRCTFHVPLDEPPTNQYIVYTLDIAGNLTGAISEVYLAVVNHPTITGTVKTPEGRPIYDAVLSFVGPSGPQTTTTDFGGAYGVLLPPATYKVTVVSAPGSNIPAKVSSCTGRTVGPACSVDLSAGDAVANFTKPATTVMGTIVDQAGRRQVGTTVNLTGTSTEGKPVSQQTTTDQNGKYDFGPPPGRYTVTPQVPSADADVANGFRADSCPGGRAAQGACMNLTLAPNATVVVNFAYGCGVEGDRLDALEPLLPTESETEFGAIPGTDVTLTGKGFCPDMTVEFGNDLAKATVTDQSGTDISAGGTKAFVTVPRLATTGTVTLSSDGHTATLRHVAIDSFRNVYGFNFPNFGAPLTVEMFEHVFGLTNTTEVVTTNTCPPGNCPVKHVVMTPQAQDEFVNIAIAFDRGNCFGFALGAARLANGGDLTPADLGETADSAWGITEDDNISTFLAQQQLTVYSNQVRQLLTASYQADATLKGPELLSNISSAIGLDAAGSDEYTAGAIITFGSGQRAHAVLAYHVEKGSSGEDTGAVDVYDSNYPYEAFPEQARLGIIHAQRVESSRLFINPDGTWDYPGDKLAGYPRQIAVVPASQVIGALTAGLSFANPNGVVSVIGPGTVVGSLLAPDGSAVNLAQGSQGVVLNPTPDGAGPSQQTFSGPYGTYVETLSGNGPLSETVQMQGFGATIAAGGGRDKVVVDTITNTVSVGPASTGSPSPTATITIDHPTPNGGVQTATITGSPRAGPLTLGFAGSGQVTVLASAHRARSVPLSFTNQVTGQVPQQFSSTLELPPGNTGSLLPNWADPAAGSLVATVGRPGGPSKPETLDNRAHAPAEPRLSRLRTSGHTLLEPVTLPPLPPGSTLTITTTFLLGAKVEHHQTTVLKYLGRASARTLRVPIPTGLPAGSKATAVLVAVTGGAPGVVITSSATIGLGPGT